MIQFPREFLWGAAASAYQVEGGNTNADWWRWEIETGKTRSGQACRHYELYLQDFDLAKELRHNAHRFSIEWSRIEPEEGKFSPEAMAHYVSVVTALRERGIEPVVTLHHFTNPIWFSERGGWERKGSVARFLRFCEYAVKALAPHVRYWTVINEPTIYIAHSYILGNWPPQSRNLFRARRVEYNLIDAYVKASRLIKALYAEAGLAAPLVGIAHHMQAFVPCRDMRRDRLAASLRESWYNLSFLDRLAGRKAMDFIGLNYYSRQVVEVKGWGVSNIAMDTCTANHHPVPKNSLGWDIWPQGIHELLLKMRRYKLPVLITENGICTGDDGQRWQFIREHLRCIHQAMREGVPVLGYLYWSLTDNFEWDKGFVPRFGLLGVDYTTFARTVRDSAKKFAKVCETGTLEEG